MNQRSAYLLLHGEIVFSIKKNSELSIAFGILPDDLSFLQYENFYSSRHDHLYEELHSSSLSPSLHQSI